RRAALLRRPPTAPPRPPREAPPRPPPTAPPSPRPRRARGPRRDGSTRSSTAPRATISNATCGRWSRSRRRTTRPATRARARARRRLPPTPPPGGPGSPAAETAEPVHHRVLHRILALDPGLLGDGRRTALLRSEARRVAKPWSTQRETEAQ